MGFFDTLGDIADTFKDVGEQSLGVTMDLAKASYHTGTGTTGYAAAQQFNSSFGRRYNEFTDEHKTLSAATRRVLGLAEGGLQALAYPAHLQMRAASTAIMYTDPFNPGHERALSLKDAWDQSAKTSVGQAVLVGVGAEDKKHPGINFKNAWKYGERGSEQYDPWFSWTSGTFDATMAFTDPLILGGKAAKVARLSAEAIKSEDVVALGGAKTPGNKVLWRAEGPHTGPGYAGKVDERTGRYFTDSKAKAERYMPKADGRLLRVEVTPDEVQQYGLHNASDHAILPDALLSRAEVYNPTRRQAATVRKFNSILDATDGTDAYANYTLFQRHGATNAAGLASVLAQAKDDRAVRSLVLRHSMGDETATATLAAQRADLMDQIDRMNAGLDDMFDVANPYKTADHGGLFDVDYYDNEASRTALANQRDESEALLDTYNRTLGAGTQRQTEDEVGLFSSQHDRFSPTRRDLSWMKHSRAYHVQPGVGGIVKRVAASPRNLRPSGYVDFHDADQGVREIEALTRRVPNLDPDTRVNMLNKYINAVDDNARRQVLESIDNTIYRHLGTEYGYADEDIKALIQRIASEREQFRFKSGNGRLYGFTGKDKVSKDPLLETQMENGHFTMPVDLAKRILRRNAGRYAALKNAGDQSWAFLDAMGDFVNDLWKFEALFRGGYPLRNLADNQLRMIAFLGAHQYATAQWANLKNAASREAVRTRRYFGGPTRPTRYFHGSDHDIKIGDVVRPGVKGSNYPENWQQNGFVWATELPGEAVAHGKFQYELEPVGDLVADGPGRWKSAQGFRVVRKMDDAGLKKAVRQYNDPNRESPILGMGTIDIGGYRGIADAMGTTPDQANQVLAQISGAQSVANMFGDSHNAILNRLRGSGNWRSIDGTDPEWGDAYLRVVNGQLRNSEIAQRLLRGDSPEQVTRWLRSAEARHIRRRMMHQGDDAETLVLNNIENLNHLLPQEMWSEFARRPMTADDITTMWPTTAERPSVHAEQIASQLGGGVVGDVWAKVRDGYFNAVSNLTDDAMGRHPLFVQLYRGKMSELLKRSDPTLSGALEPELQKAIEASARKWARREMTNIAFDVAQKSDLAHFVRFIMPFYAAWQDAMTKYGRMIVRDPSRLGYLQQFWTAPNDAAFVEVVNEDGEPVPSNQSHLSDNEYVRIPYGWAKKLGIPWTPAISKSSFNIALQGDPIWAPGWGPMGTVPVNQFIRKTENPTMASAAEDLGILPFGVQDYGKYGWKAFLAGSLRQQAQSEARWARLKTQILVDATYEARKEGKPDPTWADVEDQFNFLKNLRFFTSALSPVAVQYQSPYQFYIDQSHAYDAAVGTRFKDFEQADAAYLKDFKKDAYIFRTSLSQTNVNIRPSIRADMAARKVKDLVNRYPKYAAIFIGPDNSGEYDRNIYAMQSARKIAGSSSTWRDTYDDPEEGLRRNRVEQGWIEYQKLSTRLNVAAENGADPDKIAQIKHDWIEAVAGANGPAWGTDWYNDYQEFGSSSITEFLGAARAAVADKRINNRMDIQALGTYLVYRDKIRALLQQRYHAGGSAVLTAQSNADVAAVWSQLTSALVQANPTFEEYWNRYLERDDLSKVVK